MTVKATSREGDDLAIILITSVTYDDVNDSVFALPDSRKESGRNQTESVSR